MYWCPRLSSAGDRPDPINRFSLYLEQFSEIEIRKSSVSMLVGSQQLGIAMVILGSALLV
jgi:hypothetical protein